MTKIADLHNKWLQDPQYRADYKRLAPEFEIARAIIQLRAKSGSTQEQLADRIQTSQSVIARLEVGHTKPSTKTLQRIAGATATRLRISFERASSSSRS